MRCMVIRALSFTRTHGGNNPTPYCYLAHVAIVDVDFITNTICIGHMAQ